MRFNCPRFTVRAMAFFAVAFFASKPALVSAAPPRATATTPTLRFPSANGIVTYRMTMGGGVAMNSTITMTWTNYGARFRQDSQMSVNGGGRKVNMKSWSLFDGKAFYVGMPSGIPGQPAGRKMAMKMTLPPNYLKSMTMGGPSVGSSGRLVGHGVVLGKTCEIRVVPIKNSNYAGQVKVWMWQKLPLRTEMTSTTKMSGKTQNIKMTMVATQINTAAKPSPALFRVPAGYTVQSMGDFQKQMQGRRGR